MKLGTHSDLTEEVLRALWGEFIGPDTTAAMSHGSFIEAMVEGDAAVDAETHLLRALDQLKQNRDAQGGARLEFHETEYLIAGLQRFADGVPLAVALGIERSKRGAHPKPASDRHLVTRLVEFLAGKGYLCVSNPSDDAAMPTAYEVAADIMKLIHDRDWNPSTIRTGFKLPEQFAE